MYLGLQAIVLFLKINFLELTENICQVPPTSFSLLLLFVSFLRVGDTTRIVFLLVRLVHFTYIHVCSSYCSVMDVMEQAMAFIKLLKKSEKSSRVAQSSVTESKTTRFFKVQRWHCWYLKIGWNCVLHDIHCCNDH